VLAVIALNSHSATLSLKTDPGAFRRPATSWVSPFATFALHVLGVPLDTDDSEVMASLLGRRRVMTFFLLTKKTPGLRVQVGPAIPPLL